MAGQKARMLEGFFSSYRLREALGTNPDAVGPLEAEARANLAAGKAALTDGRIIEAMELFDAGMRAVTRAIALTSPGTHWDARAASDAFMAQRRYAESYLVVLERADDLSDTDNAEVVSLRARLGEADRQFADGELKPARETLEHVYRDIVGLVSEIRRGHTVVVSRVFETARDEFEYERQRNRSYDLLVQIALAERSGDQPGLGTFAARLVADSEALRDKAEQEGTRGEFATAIGTMERATERLLVVLRATGLLMME
jgi:tetratricopeptide (TPR) repeat protein